ncbi:uncharacterized protein LOC143920470 [Arctopsyche grandis]|uniref:uncharacterized protein LOC143920470 n=1 Tax=Arctopsyche grandis TaxID=121162 RepID=UPI00406D7824
MTTKDVPNQTLNTVKERGNRKGKTTQQTQKKHQKSNQTKEQKRRSTGKSQNRPLAFRQSPIPNGEVLRSHCRQQSSVCGWVGVAWRSQLETTRASTAVAVDRLTRGTTPALPNTQVTHTSLPHHNTIFTINPSLVYTQTPTSKGHPPKSITKLLLSASHPQLLELDMCVLSLYFIVMNRFESGTVFGFPAGRALPVSSPAKARLTPAACCRVVSFAAF